MTQTSSNGSGEDTSFEDHNCMDHLGDLVRDDHGYSYECQVCGELKSDGRISDTL